MSSYHSSGGKNGNGGFDPLEDPEAVSAANLYSRGQTLNGKPLSAHNPHGTEPEVMAAGGGFESLTLRTPAHIVIARETMQNDEGLSLLERDIAARVRLETFSALLGELLSGPLDLESVGMNVILWGWDLQRPEVAHLTQQEIANMTSTGQTRAAVCERHKRNIQRKKERVGQKGTRSPRQKAASLTSVYRASATGNQNRSLAAGKERLAASFARKKV